MRELAIEQTEKGYIFRFKKSEVLLNKKYIVWENKGFVNVCTKGFNGKKKVYLRHLVGYQVTPATIQFLLPGGRDTQGIKGSVNDENTIDIGGKDKETAEKFLDMLDRLLDDINC